MDFLVIVIYWFFFFVIVLNRLLRIVRDIGISDVRVFMVNI